MSPNLLTYDQIMQKLDATDQQGCSLFSPDFVGALAQCLRPQILDQDVTPGNEFGYSAYLKTTAEEHWRTAREAINKAACGPTLARLLSETLGVPFRFEKDVDLKSQSPKETNQTPLVYRLNTRTADSGRIYAADTSFVATKARWRDNLLRRLCEWRAAKSDPMNGRRKAPDLDYDALTVLFAVPTSSGQTTEVYGTRQIEYDCDGPRREVIGHRSFRESMSKSKMDSIFGKFARDLARLPLDAEGHLAWDPREIQLSFVSSGGGFSYDMPWIDIRAALMREAALFVAAR